MRVLIIGGYGVFGGRLAGLLADEPRAQLVIAGRSLDKARAFSAGAANREPAAFDRDGDVEAQVRALAPELVVDASGPFQAYGGSPYRVVDAALAAGASYLDIADSAQFVGGISAHDADAKAKGLFVLSGASTFPDLTAAVARELSAGLDWIHAIVGGIAPSPYAGVGLNVIEAICASGGKPVPLRWNGRKRTGYPLVETMRYTIAPPGRRPLDSRRFSLVDVPDLTALPLLWPQVRTVWMGAGPTPEILHRALNALAWGVRLKLLPSLSPLSPLLHWAANHIRWGEHRGGMFVRLTGYLRNRPIERSWHLLAAGDDGPLISSMTAQALILRCLDGRPPKPGARAGAGELDLADYETLFAGRAIHTGRREQSAASLSLPLFRRMLGEAFDRLSPALQAMHEPGEHRVATGRARVERGGNPLGWLVGAMLGFPRAGEDVPLSVGFTARSGAEVWRRVFDGKVFLSEGRGRWQNLACEQFGPVRVAWRSSSMRGGCEWSCGAGAFWVSPCRGGWPPGARRSSMRRMAGSISTSRSAVR